MIYWFLGKSNYEKYEKGGRNNDNAYKGGWVNEHDEDHYQKDNNYRKGGKNKRDENYYNQDTYYYQKKPQRQYEEKQNYRQSRKNRYQ